MCDTENMKIYNAGKDVPEEAKKPILGGRLKGMTDINPMWRIKKLTEIFGPCGIGWKLVNERYRFEKCEETLEVACIYELDLVYFWADVWNEPVHGIGGAMYVSIERDGNYYVDDEAVKKARTDALSVACKMIGIGASVYWEKGNESKYGAQPNEPQQQKAPAKAQPAKTAQPANTAQAPKAAPTAPAEKKPSKYQQVAALIKADTTEYWNMETVNEWIKDRMQKDCRVNDLPDDVFEELTARMRGQA